jgi:hypothetical protein
VLVAHRAAVDSPEAGRRCSRLRTGSKSSACPRTSSAAPIDRVETWPSRALSEDAISPTLSPSIATARVGHAFYCFPPRLNYYDFQIASVWETKRERSPRSGGRVQKPLPASHQAYLILVPAAVAAAENVTGRACASSPLMFFADLRHPRTWPRVRLRRHRVGLAWVATPVPFLRPI